MSYRVLTSGSMDECQWCWGFATMGIRYANTLGPCL